MPQGFAKLVFSTAPKRPVPSRRLLRLVGPQPLQITGSLETPAERVERVLKVIRERCAGYLSADDLEIVTLKPDHGDQGKSIIPNENISSTVKAKPGPAAVRRAKARAKRRKTREKAQGSA